MTTTAALNEATANIAAAKIAMTASELRMLAESMGPADEVEVEISERVADGYWHLVARAYHRERTEQS
jgi:hypothetical protein